MSPKRILPVLIILSLILGGIATNVQAAMDADTFPTSRDPIQWPYPANSIWNMPIHNNAEYVYAGINQMPTGSGVTIDEELLILEPNAPLKQVRENTAGWDGSKTRCGSLTSNYLWGGMGVPVPNNFHTDPGYDGNTPNMSAAILMPDGVTLKETQPLHVCSDGGIVTSQYTWPDKNIKTSDGIAGSHGGTGMSAFGGDVRVNELLPGSVIRHAIKMNFFGHKYYAYNNDGTRGYRWPAPQADGYAGDCSGSPGICYGGTISAFEVGALLALKPDFNVANLRTEPARIIAKAMQDYGVYAVDDTAWDVYALLVEWGPDGRVQDQFQQTWGWEINTGVFPNCTNTSDNACQWSKDLWDMVSNLYVINNNTASTIGGGPNSDTTNRRAPQAPPFIGESTATALPPTQATTWKIMPIGDSITEGDYPNANHSWRGYLRTHLIQNGYNIDFVGDRSKQAHGDTAPYDLEHAGHGGYTIGPDTQTFCTGCETTGIYEHIDSWVNQTGQVDVFMVLIGINDMFNAANHPANYAATADDRLGDLVAKLQQLRPNAKILLSSLLKVRWTDGAGWTEYLDVNAKAAALANASATDNIYFVDLNSVNLVYADFADDVHLAQGGAQKVADGWYNGLTPLLSGGTAPTNTPVPPTATVDPNAYIEDFNDGQAQGWTLTNCAVSNNALACDGFSSTNRAINDGRTFSGAYTFKVDLSSWATGYNDNIVYFNYSDANNTYAVKIRDNNAAVLTKKVGGTETTLATGPTYNLYNSWATIEIVYNGSNAITVKATRAGSTTTLFNNISDTARTSGKIGLEISNNHLDADNISVTVSGGAPTNTPIPPTNTPVPPTATRTNTSIPPTATRTNTAVPPTNTPIPVTGAVTKVRFYPRSGWAARMNGGKVQGSNTSSTSGFVDLLTISSTPADNAWTELTFSNSTVYRYIRYLSPTGGYGNVAELEFYAGTIRLTGSGFGTAGSWNNSGNTFDKALDGTTSTFFDAPTADGNYVGIDTGSASPTNTPTRTNTAVPPTATRTPTKTNTAPAATATPTRTATRTPTRTNTPASGYSENFDDGLAQNWTLTSASVSSNKLVMENWGGVAQGIYTGQTFSGNYTYKVTAFTWATGYNNNTFYFNYTDANNYYALVIKDNNAARLVKKVGGTETTIATGAVYSIYNVSTLFEIKYETGGYITVKATKSGTTTTLFNRTPDTSLTSGKLGAAIVNNHLEIDNVIVTVP